MFNLPYGTEVEEQEGFLYHDGKCICVATSENAHQFFSVNEDGKGLERGKFTQEIQKILSKRDSRYQERWDKVWADPRCKKYKRVEHADFWLWNHTFFNASIEDLMYIGKLISL